MKNNVLFVVILIGISLLFFYKFVFLGLIPFPGDLLVAEYNPWKSYSFLGYNPGSYPHKAQYFDTLRQLYPWKTIVIEDLRNGIFPLWNQYNFSGSPLFANSQSAVLYPATALYFLFSQHTAWGLSVLMQPLLASLFTYFFVRALGLSKIASLFSGVAYGYCLFMGTFLEYNTLGHIMALLPLSLLAIENIVKRFSYVWSFIFAGSIALTFFAGHFQLAGFSLLFVAFYAGFSFFFLKKKYRLQRVLFIFVLLIFGALLSGVQLVPTLELVQNSARVPQDYTFLREVLLLQPYQLSLFLNPDLFGNPVSRNYLIHDTYPGNAIYFGLIPFIFAFFALPNFKKNQYVKFFLGAGIVLITLLTDNLFTQYFYRFNIPFFSTGSPTNAIYLLVFSFAVLAGIGMDLMSKKITRDHILVSILCGVIIALLWVFMLTGVVQLSSKNLIFSTGIFGAFCFLMIVSIIKLRFSHLILSAFIFITIFDLLYYFIKFNPFVKKELLYPQTDIVKNLERLSDKDRFWGYANANVEANYATQLHLFSPEGYDPLYPKMYGEFIHASRDGKLARNFGKGTRSDAVVVNGNGDTFQDDIYRKKVLDALSVKYILDKDNGTSEKSFPPDSYKNVYQKDGWKIYDNSDSVERAYFVDTFISVKSSEEFEQRFFDENFDPKTSVLLYEQLHDFKTKVDFGAAYVQPKISITNYKSSTVRLSTESSNEKILVLTDTYFPGWNAYIDGRPTKIYRANHAFRAVVVPGGKHEIEFLYQPSSFSTGVKTSIMSLILLPAFLIFVRKKYVWR